MAKTQVGIVGCGNITEIYMTNIGKIRKLEVAAVADLVPERARRRRRSMASRESCTVEEMLDDPAIDIVLNLTIPLPMPR